MKYVEVERKFSLSDPVRMRSRLTELKATFIGQSRQIDVYYNHPTRDFLAHEVVSEWLRLRTDQANGDQAMSSINFKRWLPVGSAEATHADEYESPIGDQEAVTRLMEALGFTEIVTVDKHRQRWHLAIPAGPVAIDIDEVVRLGAFTEFEYIGAGDLNQAEQAIDHAVQAVGVVLGDRDRRGYPYLMLGREK